MHGKIGCELLKTVEIEVEVGERFAVNILLEVNGFGIPCQENIEYWNPETDNIDLWKPSRDDVKPLVSEVKEVMEELHIQQPPYFVLYFKKQVNMPANCVGKRRQIFYVSLPIRFTNGKPCIKRKHDLYHELMHIKDVLCGRFPSIGRGNHFHALMNLLWGFSIEGRLERMGKPHIERQKAANQSLFLGVYGRKELISKEKAEKLCEEFWGKEVRYEEIKPIAKKLIHACK